MTGNMANVVRGMDRAMESMNLERISGVMDKFEQQFEDLDVQAGYMDTAMGQTTAQSQPQQEVDGLLMRIADENGIERQQELETPVPQNIASAPQQNPQVSEDGLNERLRAIRG